MLDILLILATAAFFVLAILYVFGCDQLGRERNHEHK